MATKITKVAGGDLDTTNRVGADVSTVEGFAENTIAQQTTFVQRIGSFADTKIVQLDLLNTCTGTDLTGLLVAIDNACAAQISKVKITQLNNTIGDPPTLEQEDKIGFTSVFLVTMASGKLRKFKIFVPYRANDNNNLAAWTTYVVNNLVGDGVALVTGGAWGDGHCQLYFDGMKRHATEVVVKHLITHESVMAN